MKNLPTREGVDALAKHDMCGSPSSEVRVFPITKKLSLVEHPSVVSDREVASD